MLKSKIFKVKLLSYRYFPIHILVLYTFFTFSVLVLGPVKYKNFDYYSVLVFIFIFLLIFVLHFILGVHGSNFYIRNNPKFHQQNFIKAIIITGALISLKMWVIFMFSDKSLSLSMIGKNYISLYDGYERGKAIIGVSYIYSIFEQAMLTIVLLIIFSHFSLLPLKFKINSLFIIGTFLLINVVGYGKQKYLGDVVIFFSYSYFVNMAVKRVRIKFAKVFLFFIIFAAVLLLFSYILDSRYSAIGIDTNNIVSAIHPFMFWNADSILLTLFGEKIGFPLGMFLGYFTNGLYGLSICLNMPFEWTYFLGSSYSLAKIVEVFSGYSGLIVSHAYPFRAEEIGWGLSKWHSAFSWFASDFSFLGVLILASVSGFIYGRFWKLSVINRNPFAKPIFLYLSLGVMFLYSNNQMFHSLSGVIAFLTLSILYVLSKGQNFERVS